MVSRNDNLDTMWLALEPIKLLLNISSCTRLSEVSGVDENVAGWDVNGLLVGIGDAHNPNCRLVAGRMKRFAAKKEEEVVEFDGEKGQW